MRKKRLVTVLGLLLTGVVAGAYLSDALVGSIDRVSIEESERERRNRGVDIAADHWTPLSTGLHSLEAIRIPVANLAPGGGGAMAAINDHILVVGRRGIIEYLAADGSVQSLNARVPMNLEALLASDLVNEPRFRLQFFRVHGLLAIGTGTGQVDLLVSHHRFAGSCFDWVISRIRLQDRGGRLEVLDPGWTRLFKAEPCIPLKEKSLLLAGHQGGGVMVALSEDEILFSVGDHKFDGVYGDKTVVTNPGNHLGKIVSLNLKTLKAEIFASGVRNPQGLVLARDGRIWETEHGPRGGDEINLISRGGDYGWPEVTYGLDYGGEEKPWPFNPQQGRHEGYIAPKFAFLPSVGASRIIEIGGSEFPLWKGDLILASLMGDSLYRLRPEGDEIVYAERIAIGGQLRDLIQLENGLIAMLERGGDIIFLRKQGSEQRGPDHAKIAELRRQRDAGQRAQASQINDVERGRFIFESTCSLCHALVEQHGAGPHLVDLIGRKAGALDGFGYSTSLMNANFRWDRKSLRTFFSKRWKLLRPTNMPNIQLTEEEVDALVDYLESI